MLIMDVWKTEIPKEYCTTSLVHSSIPLMILLVFREQRWRKGWLPFRNIPGQLYYCPFSSKLASTLWRELSIKQRCVVSPRLPDREYMSLNTCGSSTVIPAKYFKSDFCPNYYNESSLKIEKITLFKSPAATHRCLVQGRSFTHLLNTRPASYSF